MNKQAKINILERIAAELAKSSHATRALRGVARQAEKSDKALTAIHRTAIGVPAAFRRGLESIPEKGKVFKLPAGAGSLPESLFRKRIGKMALMGGGLGGGAAIASKLLPLLPGMAAAKALGGAAVAGLTPALPAIGIGAGAGAGAVLLGSLLHRTLGKKPAQADTRLRNADPAETLYKNI